MSATTINQICEAIRLRVLLAFEYQGYPRLVEPYCHGTSTTGDQVLRAVQVGGSSKSGGLGFGKLWSLADMKSVRLTGENFVPSDPSYNPDDRHMKLIHCRI